MTKTTTIASAVENGVARLVLNHPPLNILTRHLLTDLREELEALSAQRSLRVAVLMAEGKHFSAGADVGEHLPPNDAELIPEFVDTIAALDAFPVPVIAAVRGQCLGGGFELVQAADLIVAGQSATFGQPEIKLGVIPPAACVLLRHKIMPSAVAQLIYTGDSMDAGQAAAAGLVARVVDDAEVDAVALEIAGRIARQSAATLRLAKRALRGGTSEVRAAALRHAGESYLDDVMATDDALEGLMSFMEKRRPVWKHT
ncbi:MAG: enoyl-CoA hydratase/isomerase family protein [Gemmatimonadetes bacterium]|nr:enoyl-CoA hydratase/isomerase family protein [Gemmatimonadota bacterium]